jgi:phage shock protein PspC (stress-responsive transcriptional regulator)
MIALSALQATLGLVVVFFVVFPLLAHGLIAFIIAQVLGERAENREFTAGTKQPSHRG